MSRRPRSGAFADGVIVGSALVRALTDAPSAEAGVEAVRQLAAELAAGVHSVSKAPVASMTTSAKSANVST